MSAVDRQRQRDYADVEPEPALVRLEPTRKGGHLIEPPLREVHEHQERERNRGNEAEPLPELAHATGIPTPGTGTPLRLEPLPSGTPGMPAATLEAGSMKSTAALVLTTLSPFTIGSCQGSHTERTGVAAVEAAALRYEKAVAAREREKGPEDHVRAVDCSGKHVDSGMPPFRGHQAFRCVILGENEFGSYMAIVCYALIGDALYAVGGCFDPMRDIGRGNGRLLDPG